MTSPGGAALVSLLRPPGYTGLNTPKRLALSENDLGLSLIVPALDIDRRHSRFIAEVLGELNPDPEIIKFRQEILEDLLALPELVAGLTDLLPQLGALATYGRGGGGWGEEPSPIFRLTTRLSELEHFVSCVEGLSVALGAAGANLRASGLVALRSFVEEVRAAPDYQSLLEKLPGLRELLRQAGSITVGINLDNQLRPASATLLSINPGHFGGKSNFLERLLAGDWTANNTRGLTALYRAQEGKTSAPEHELFRDLNELLEKIISPVAEALAQYTRLNSGPFVLLEPEVAFYLGAVKLTNELRALGLPLCRPEIAPACEKICQISGVYSLDLALRLRARLNTQNPALSIVPNDVNFGPEANIFILTGPNSGGKTTYTRAVGQAQVLFQAGLLIPGLRARISPVDAIFTHFSTAERLDTNGGRLEEELGRLEQIFSAATSTSLILLNEPLASTDHISARALSKEILAGLCLLGARTIYVTHLYELVEDAVTIAASATGARVVSLVAGINAYNGNSSNPAPSYVITPGLPHAPGYATELARRYKLSLPQIAQLLKERGIGS